MLVRPNSFMFSNWISLYSSRTALKSGWLGPSCMASTVTLLLMTSAGLYVVKRLSSSISISSSHPRSMSSCWGVIVERNPFSWSSFITSTISWTVLGSPIRRPKAFSMAVSGSGRLHCLTMSSMQWCQHWSAGLHTFRMPLASYSHLAVFTSYSSGLWLGLPIGWLYSIGVLSFCPLLSKTSLFLLKRRSAEYLLNQSVPTNKAALGASMTIRSIRTLVSAIAKGAPQTKPITFFLAWSTATMLLPSAGLICNHNCLTIGKVMMDTDALLSIMALTG